MTITCLGNVSLPSPHTPLRCLNTCHSSFCSTYGSGSSTGKKVSSTDCFWTPKRELPVLTSAPVLSYFSCLPHIIFPLSSSSFSSFFLRKKKGGGKESWKFSTNQMCFAKHPPTSMGSLCLLNHKLFLSMETYYNPQLKEERDQDIWLSCTSFISQSKLRKKVVGEGGLWKISSWAQEE